MLVFIVSEQHVPYLNPHGVAVEGFGLFRDVHTQTAQRPVKGFYHRIVRMVKLVIRTDKQFFCRKKVDARIKTAR